MELERFPKAMPLREGRDACRGGEEALSARGDPRHPVSTPPPAVPCGSGHSPGLRGALGAPPTPWRGWRARCCCWSPGACRLLCLTCPRSVCGTDLLSARPPSRSQTPHISTPSTQISPSMPRARLSPQTRGGGRQPTSASPVLSFLLGPGPSLGAGTCSAFHCGCKAQRGGSRVRVTGGTHGTAAPRAEEEEDGV